MSTHRRRRRRRRSSAGLIIGLIVLALLAAALVAGILYLQKNARPTWDGGYSLRISEVMTDNVNTPDPTGALCDWVELENVSSRAFDLGGYYLSDEAGVGKYAFPAGTSVPANGFLVVWCDPLREECAPFALKKEGGESVCLMTPNRVVMDQAATVACASGQSLIRSGDGSLVPCDTPTPGYANDSSGAAAWQSDLAGRNGSTLELSEIMSSNTLFAAPDGGYYDWVEIVNPTGQDISLAGYKLSDREEKSKFTFPADKTLSPGETYVVWCAAGAAGEDMAPFALSSDGGESVVLTGPSGAAVDSVELPALEKNSSYVKSGGVWQVSGQPTPGHANTDSGYAEYMSAGNYEQTPVEITELMEGNKGFCADADNEFSDWIELANLGGEPLDLTGWYLSDTPEEPTKWQIPSLPLGAGEHVRVWASGKSRQGDDGLHAGFSLKEGETVCLTAPNGTVVRSVPVSGAEEGSSLVLADDGSYASCDFPTPGYPNNADGYLAFCQADERAPGLQLWEIVVYDPARNDWVELKNTSQNPIELSNYTVTDKKSEPARMRLPAATVNPGESIVVELQGFGLSASREAVYLYDSAGRAVDWAFLRGIPTGGSYGRTEGENGFFYFTEQTPGRDNGQGWRGAAAMPSADKAPGVYPDETSLTVTLSGENVYYTTDGSRPTAASTPYTGPIQITGVTILRAVSLPAGQLPSDVLTLSYFLGERSTLPVVSLVADHDDLFGPKGIYSHHDEAWQNKWEREANVSFFEEDGSFSIDCGVRIHGRVSRGQSEKRSLKLEFRGRYGGDLNYDVFGDGKITDFSSLILRGSLQDTSGGYVIDNLFASMAMDFTDVPAMNYRYVTLYINGEYWGVYSLREHHSEEYFASHYGVDPDTVEVFNGEFRYPGTFNDLLTYAENHDLNSAESWQYIRAHLDVEEMIDWMILECYGGDIDVYENVRFYSSPEYKDNAVLYGLVDMDLCMSNHQTYAVGFECWPQLHAIIPRGLMYNPEFKDMFLTRLGALLKNELSDAAVQARIETLRAQVEPEAAKDLARWGLDGSFFNASISRVTGFTAGRAEEMKNSAIGYFGLGGDQIQKYFG